MPTEPNPLRGAPTTDLLCTHTMKSPPFGKFCVWSPDYWVFLEKYCAALASDLKLDLVERLSTFAPLLVDLDITYTALDHLPPPPGGPRVLGAQDSPPRVFESASLLRALVTAFRRAIYALSGTETRHFHDTTRAVVMVRAHSRQLPDGRYTDGVHIVFPEAVVAWPGHVRARTLALQDSDLQTSFAEASRRHVFAQTLDQAVDDAFAKKKPNLGQIYGSSAPNNPAGPYLVKCTVAPRLTTDDSATDWVPCGEPFPASDGCLRVNAADDWDFWTRELSVMWPRNEPMSICAPEEGIMGRMEEEMAERERQADARRPYPVHRTQRYELVERRRRAPSRRTREVHERSACVRLQVLDLRGLRPARHSSGSATCFPRVQPSVPVQVRRQGV